MNVNSLDRFLKAQEDMYETALKEIKNGEKESHWMWYIFPQLRGLGKSELSYFMESTELRKQRLTLIIQFCLLN